MKKLLLLLLCVPLLVSAQKQSSEYQEVIDIIEIIDQEIADKKNQLKRHILAKSKTSANQSHFEEDEKYIDRIYSEIYSENYGEKLDFDSTLLKLIDEISNLRSKRIYNKSFVFEGEEINLNFIDSNYDANTSIWRINGSYSTREFNNNQSMRVIDWFNLKISPESAEFIFINQSNLIIKGRFVIKYGDICLTGVKIDDPISGRIISFDFPELTFKSVMSPYTSVLSDTAVQYIEKQDSLYVIHNRKMQFESCQFSQGDKFLVMGGEDQLLLFDLELNSLDTIYYNTKGQVYYDNGYGSYPDGFHLMHQYHVRTYQLNNSHQWNIRRTKYNKNRFPRNTSLIDFKISPNDSVLVFILTENVSSRKENWRGYKARSFIVSYKIYENKYMYYMPSESLSSGISIKLDNISFPFNESDYFYLTNYTQRYLWDGRYWDEEYNKQEYKIDKINISDRIISRTNQYNIDSGRVEYAINDINNINLSYDNRFFLIESNISDDSNTYIYNIGKGIIQDYILPAPYYRMFADWNNKFRFSMPEVNDQNKKLDIRCPECNEYLTLEDNNVFVCKDRWDGCEGEFAIVNDKFYRVGDYTFSSNRGLIALNDRYNVNIFFTKESACELYGSFLDDCGDCVGGGTGRLPCREDCNGVLGGKAFIDDCGVCSGGNTNIIPNSNKDLCGDCFGNNSSCIDCNNVVNGTAYIDKCGNCVGGNTNINPCKKDCSGYYTTHHINGKAFIDDCNRCVSGHTNLLPCTKKYYSNGNLKSVYHETNFSRIFEQEFYESGVLKKEISYDLENKYEKYYNNIGNRDGTITYWYNNLNIKSQKKYSNGELEKGTHKEFFYNGNISSKIVIKNNNGYVIRYDIRGKKIDKFPCDRQGIKID